MIKVRRLGHATLATAHVLWEQGRAASGSPIAFHTLSGVLTASRTADVIELDFPVLPAEEAAAPEGLAVVHQIARRSDVVLQCYRAGVAARIGIDEPTLKSLNPALVYLSAPGYGIDGPYGGKPAYAPSIGAASGVSLTDAPLSSVTVLENAEVEKRPSPELDSGMYFNNRCAGVDHARCGMSAFGNTHCEGVVQPGV